MMIPSLKRSEEKALLALMLSQLDVPLDNRLHVRVKRQIVLLPLSFSLPLLLLAALRAGSGLTAAAAVGALVVGFALAFCFHRAAGARQWPVIARCLDRAEIERRLQELDA
jgi:multisubunit Na+/H+ antiporter MnhB subunit